MPKHSELTEHVKVFHFVSIPTTVTTRNARKTNNDRLPEALQSEAFVV